jgi:secreted trypsin-like serine protease
VSTRHRGNSHTWLVSSRSQTLSILLITYFVAIGWKDDNENIHFACGGSLISEKFVITVAHCAKNQNEKAPSVVRLGEHNLASTDDDASPVDYEIEEIIKHPDYRQSSKENDIALIKLKKNVTFNANINPSCLPQTNETKKVVIAVCRQNYCNNNEITKFFHQTGWGQNGTFGSQADVLQKVKIDVITNSECQEKYEDEYRTIKTSQICAGMQGKVRNILNLVETLI